MLWSGHLQRRSTNMRSTAFAFAIEVERQIEALTMEAFHSRSGHSKVLQEEWYPIARLAVHLKQPGLVVDVEAFGNSGAADGHIVESGFREREFDVQVTYVHDYEESLRRELMVTQGFSPGTGTIARDRKSGAVVATMAAVDADHNVTQVASAIVERFQKKSAMSYKPNTVLIIAFEDMTLRGRVAWAKLFSLVESQVSLSASNFQSVYILNCSTNELQQAA